MTPDRRTVDVSVRDNIDDLRESPDETLIKEFYQVINRLPPKTKKVFIFCHGLDRDGKPRKIIEVASLLHLRPDTVSIYLSRAHRSFERYDISKQFKFLLREI